MSSLVFVFSLRHLCIHSRSLLFPPRSLRTSAFESACLVDFSAATSELRRAALDYGTRACSSGASVTDVMQVKQIPRGFVANTGMYI